jgi:hypothetical protein
MVLWCAVRRSPAELPGRGLKDTYGKCQPKSSRLLIGIISAIALLCLQPRQRLLRLSRKFGQPQLGRFPNDVDVDAVVGVTAADSPSREYRPRAGLA